METRYFKTEFYNTGNSWNFDNGQYGEKTAIMQQDVYSLQVINGKVTGLYFHQNNNCGGQHLNSSFTPIASLKGKKLEIFNNLIQ